MLRSDPVFIVPLPPPLSKTDSSVGAKAVGKNRSKLAIAAIIYWVTNVFQEPRRAIPIDFLLF